MKEDFILPDIGEGIVECELVEWLVKVGDIVKEDQPVADVQTDKALVQIPAKHGGRITNLYVNEGELAKVHAPLFQIELESVQAETDTHNRTAPAPQQHPIATKINAAEERMAVNERSVGKVLATPAVRRIARENDIDIANVHGTGPSGRILKTDLLKMIAGGGTAKSGKRVSEDIDIIPIKGFRAVMAAQMQKSISTVPHFTYVEEIDITACNQLRGELNDSLSENDTHLTLMALFIKTLSFALLKHPIINSHINATGDEIHQYREHNIGMAVDSPSGLLVPNIKSVNQLSLTDIASEVKRLTEAGRAGRLSPSDLKGGTITISNIGAIGGTVTTPIINAPEVAIVSIGRIQKLPRPIENELQIREIIQVSWSGDHRVLDGATIARFNNEWKGLLESPQRMLLAMR